MSNKANPNHFYNLTELLEFIPFINSLPMLAKWVDADMQGENILKAIKVGSGSGTRYHIKGANINNFLDKVEDGSLDIVFPKGGDEEMKLNNENEEHGSDVEQGNEEISNAQAEERAEGVDETPENEDGDIEDDEDDEDDSE